MMAEIKQNIKFFNEKDEESMLDESFRHSMAQNSKGNMSFSFAVAAPVEMEQKHKLIGQGWKKTGGNYPEE